MENNCKCDHLSMHMAHRSFGKSWKEGRKERRMSIIVMGLTGPAGPCRSPWRYGTLKQLTAGFARQQIQFPMRDNNLNLGPRPSRPSRPSRPCSLDLDTFHSAGHMAGKGRRRRTRHTYRHNSAVEESTFQSSVTISGQQWVWAGFHGDLRSGISGLMTLERNHLFLKNKQFSYSGVCFTANMAH